MGNKIFYNGVIKFYKHTENYGFIVRDDGDEFFFHRTDLTERDAILKKGMKVRFRLRKYQNPKKEIKSNLVGTQIETLN